MTRAVVISSYVAHGGVGLRAALAAMTAAGVDAIALPTTILSNHPRHPQVAGSPVSIPDLENMSAALAANGAFAGIDGILTGYMPSAEHAEFARRTIDRVRAMNPGVVVMVDPIMGDDPGGLYVGPETARAIANRLAPAATVLTPNRFELAYLSGRRIETLEDALDAARSLAAPWVAVTSAPAPQGELATLLVHPGGANKILSDRRSSVPHGPGDLFAALLLIALLRKRPADAALTSAVAGVAHAIDVSGASLDLALSKIDWQAALAG